MSKVLQERGIKSLPTSTEPTPRDHVKSISTSKADSTEIRQAHEVKILETYDHTLPQKEKNSWSFTLPCFIHNVCFDKAFVDLGASVSVMPFSTYTNLGLGDLALTRLTIELADRTIKHPRGIAENVQVSIDVFKRKITLRIGEEKLVFKSIKPATSIIRRVYVLKEGTDLDSKTEFIGATFNESFDPHYGFSIIDAMNITSGVVLGMPFCKKFVSGQKIMKRFAHGDECERMDNE
ncbi:putative reverse transcriptase domain-containing protein [Tanacetum coccineum]